jgi:hypothetical protein
VAKGLEEIWGRERNSSRSIVPEASCRKTSVSDFSGNRRISSHWKEAQYLIELHETFAQAVHFITVDYCGVSVPRWGDSIEPYCVS